MVYRSEAPQVETSEESMNTSEGEAGVNEKVRRRRGLGVEEAFLAVLATLSIVGIAIADYSARDSLIYWLWMVPVFAGVSIYAGWERARRHGQGLGTILRGHVLHWIALPPAAYLVYVLEESGRINREAAGLVVLLTLAITTFLAGVHFDWRLAALGVLLGAAVACAAFVEEFFWALMLAAAAVVRNHLSLEASVSRIRVGRLTVTGIGR